MNTHPVAKVFAPVVFASLAFLTLAFSFGPAQAEQPASVTAAPRIERFDLDPPTRLVPGEALIFRITGTPHGTATVRIDGVKGKFYLREVMTGIYEGAYTIVQGDRIVGDSIVIGNLRLGDQERSIVLADPLVQTLPIVASL